MNAKIYLKSYGWKEGEALKKGGLKKPILVRHKKDSKGLGHDGGEKDVWWEKLFDSQLKNLEVNGTNSGSYEFNSNTEAVLSEFKKQNSLYSMFVKGEGLKGTMSKIRSKANLKASNTVSEANQMDFGIERPNSSRGQKEKFKDGPLWNKVNYQLREVNGDLEGIKAKASSLETKIDSSKSFSRKKDRKKNLVDRGSKETAIKKDKKDKNDKKDRKHKKDKKDKKVKKEKKEQKEKKDRKDKKDKLHKKIKNSERKDKSKQSDKDREDSNKKKEICNSSMKENEYLAMKEKKTKRNRNSATEDDSGLKKRRRKI